METLFAFSLSLICFHLLGHSLLDIMMDLLFFISAFGYYFWKNFRPNVIE